MDKTKKLCLATLICYCLFAIVAIVLVIACAVGAFSVPEDNEDLGTALGAAILLIFMILSGIYAAISLIPITLKLLQLRRPKTVFSIVCMIFDLAYIFVHTALLVNVIQSAEAIAAGFFAVFTLLSCAALLTNILSVKAIKENTV